MEFLRRSHLLFVMALGLVSACGPALQASKTENEPATARPPSQEDAAASSSSESEKSSDLDKLGRLWRERMQDRSITEHPVGPGDVIEVSVPPIEELRGRVVRVSGDGTISLPFIGKLQVAGLTEEQLQESLVDSLKQYMYEPRVAVFVREYRSRQVAVLGSVVRPGLYSLNTGGDTILDMLSSAGGTTTGADPRLYFIPAGVNERELQQIASKFSEQGISQGALPGNKRTEPILIDLKELALGGNQQYLSLTVRPGDLIIVPGGGQVLVEGWVQRPGGYNVTQGLTVSGAVVAAGGLLYPADDTTVKVIRSEKGGKRSFVTAHLGKIKSGEMKDVALQGGDIVEVSATMSRLIPYGVYRFFETVINVGVGASVPIAGS
jgi:polysaccharide export outer membrane protein